MTKNVLVSVVGRQFDIDEEAIELVTNGQYHMKNGKHYILYEERLSQEDDVTKNVVKIGQEIIELRKNGASTLHMIFEVGKKHYSNYHTPMGMLVVGIDTREVDWIEEEEELKLRIVYDLEVSGTFVSKCEINLHIRATM